MIRSMRGPLRNAGDSDGSPPGRSANARLPTELFRLVLMETTCSLPGRKSPFPSSVPCSFPPLRGPPGDSVFSRGRAETGISRPFPPPIRPPLSRCWSSVEASIWWWRVWASLWGGRRSTRSIFRPTASWSGPIPSVRRISAGVPTSRPTCPCKSIWRGTSSSGREAMCSARHRLSTTSASNGPCFTMPS